MRDPEMDQTFRIEEIEKRLSDPKLSDSTKKNLKNELRLLEMRRRTIRRMKKDGVKF